MKSSAVPWASGWSSTTHIHPSAYAARTRLSSFSKRWSSSMLTALVPAFDSCDLQLDVAQRLIAPDVPTEASTSTEHLEVRARAHRLNEVHECLWLCGMGTARPGEPARIARLLRLYSFGALASIDACHELV